jgi:hypothetical protein
LIAGCAVADRTFERIVRAPAGSATNPFDCSLLE